MPVAVVRAGGAVLRPPFSSGGGGGSWRALGAGVSPRCNGPLWKGWEGEGLVRGSRESPESSWSRGLWGHMGPSQGHTGLPKPGLWVLMTLDIPACTVPRLIPQSWWSRSPLVWGPHLVHVQCLVRGWDVASLGAEWMQKWSCCLHVGIWRTRQSRLFPY